MAAGLPGLGESWAPSKATMHTAYLLYQVSQLNHGWKKGLLLNKNATCWVEVGGLPKLHLVCVGGVGGVGGV